jgi:hypothetical protein
MMTLTNTLKVGGGGGREYKWKHGEILLADVILCM